MILKTIYEVKENVINAFSCGNGDLDGFLKKYAKINDENGYGKTFLLMDEKRIAGFFTLCSSSIRFEEFPEFNSHLFPKYPIPCIKIARLAVDIDYQRKGYGKELLKEAFLRIISVSASVGVRLIIVDAKESSKTFYEKYGFRCLKGEKLSYYLLIDTLIQALK